MSFTRIRLGYFDLGSNFLRRKWSLTVLDSIYKSIRLVIEVVISLKSHFNLSILDVLLEHSFTSLITMLNQRSFCMVDTSSRELLWSPTTASAPKRQLITPVHAETSLAEVSTGVPPGIFDVTMPTWSQALQLEKEGDSQSPSENESRFCWVLWWQWGHKKESELSWAAWKVALNILIHFLCNQALHRPSST